MADLVKAALSGDDLRYYLKRKENRNAEESQAEAEGGVKLMPSMLCKYKDKKNKKDFQQGIEKGVIETNI